MRAVYFVIFLLIVATVLAIGSLGSLALYVGLLKYEWMVEHNMLKHSYVYAALLIGCEVAGLLLMRRGVIHAYECFCIVYPRKEDESVRSE